MRMICRDAINIASIREGDHFGTGGLSIPHVAIGQETRTQTGRLDKSSG
jgi:hypothetical protein